jgi:hypothetical protein
LESGCCLRHASDCAEYGYGQQIAEYFDYFHLFLHFFSRYKDGPAWCADRVMDNIAAVSPDRRVR